MCFFKYHYQINEQTIQNITAHIALTLRRVRKGHFIEQQMEQGYAGFRQNIRFPRKY